MPTAAAWENKASTVRKLTGRILINEGTAAAEITCVKNKKMNLNCVLRSRNAADEEAPSRSDQITIARDTLPVYYCTETEFEEIDRKT